MKLSARLGVYTGMKPFRVFTLPAFAPLLSASSGNLQPLATPITGQEIAVLVAFLAAVGGGVFLLLRRPKDEAPRLRLDR